VETIARIAALRDAVRAARASRPGTRVGFVPTMGYLHDGHLALVDEARKRAGLIVASVFVNPTQFGPTEDLARYPRDPEGDALKLTSRGVDLLFAPSVAEMYPASAPDPVGGRSGGVSGGGIRVVPDEIASRWEGAVRPGHFSGVLTVVTKLLNIVQPDLAVFGRKDVQQATLVRRMVRELDVPVEIVVAPTVREADGLAMSSRNAYLNADERRRALALVTSLRAVTDSFGAGERQASHLVELGASYFRDLPNVTLDYFAVVEPLALETTETADASSIAIVAARVGATRLIDNAVLGEGV
jgi:pantoate--beta-alanine ligase